MAVLNGNPALVRVQLKAGNDVDATDSQGATPLMLAAGAGNVDICNVLLEAGADVMLKDTDGRDALDWARRHQQVAVIGLLEAHIRPKPEPPPAPDAAEPFVEDDEDDDDDEYDLSGWEAEEEALPPDDDHARRAAETQVHLAINDHVPVDNDEDWSDVELELPDIPPSRQRTSVLAGALRHEVHSLFLAGLRDGFVSIERVRELVTDPEDDTVDEALERHLTRSLIDLGIAVDEATWCGGAAPDDVPELGDERLADEALELLIRILADETDPASIYDRRLNNNKELLSREQEIELGRAMRSGRAEALAAIAESDSALESLLAVLGSTPAVTRSADENDDSDDDDDVVEPDEGADQAAAERLRELCEKEGRGEVPESLREMLAALKPTLVQLNAVAVEMERRELDVESQRRLVQALLKVESARQTMIESNLRLVRSVARRYSRIGPDILDIMQDGNIGLMTAVDRFDPEYGNRFSTYAIWWIRQSIRRGLDDHSRVIRIPVHMMDRIRRIERTRGKLLARDGIADAASIANALEEQLDVVEKAMGVPDQPVSLENEGEVRDDSELITLDECLPDDEPWPDDQASVASLAQVVRQLLTGLKPREAEILSLRFGLEDLKTRTLEEVGQQFELTRERIRQIEQRALTKLSKAARLAGLEDFLPGVTKQLAERQDNETDGDDD